MALAIVLMSVPASAGSIACPEMFGDLGRQWQSEADAHLRGDLAIENLQGAINLQGRFDQRHAMSVRDGQVYLQIGYLTQEDPRFLSALQAAVAAGRIRQIDVGSIIGPKVYNWIVRTSASAPEGHVMILTGKLNVGEVAKSRTAQIAKTKPGAISAFDEPGERWTAANVEQYDRAIETFRLREACRKFWATDDLEKCGSLKFILRSNSFESITWEQGK